MPFFAGIPRDVWLPRRSQRLVPVDDETTMVWRITYRPERPLTEQERPEQLSGLDAHVAPGGYLPPTAAPGSRWVPALNQANDYGLDRQAERTTRYAGVPGVWAQDRACTEAMGAIIDRTQEHLASSDLPVIKMRRLLIRVAHASWRRPGPSRPRPDGAQGRPSRPACQRDRPGSRRRRGRDGSRSGRMRGSSSAVSNHLQPHRTPRPGPDRPRHAGR
jgi:hypothetical protein